jgi:hypothetical protein
MAAMMGNDLGENGNPQEFHYKLISTTAGYVLSQPATIVLLFTDDDDGVVVVNACEHI